MKLYYLDDSFFQQSKFSHQVLFRFERYMMKHGPCTLLISSGNAENSDLKGFREVMSEMDILVSPALFDIEGVRGNLHTTFLSVEGFPSMQTYSGSFVEYDTETMKCSRIYLELFIDHEDDMDQIVEEMEHILHEKIREMSKKKTFS